jgi:hypothetical protein
MINVEIVTYTNAKKKVLSTPFAIKANGSSGVFQLPSITDTFKSLGLERSDAFIMLTCNLSKASLSSAPNTEDQDWDMMTDHLGSTTNTFFPSSFETVSLLDPRLELKDFVRDKEGQVSFKVTCSAVAPFVWLESIVKGRFNRNAFLALPGESYAVTFKAWAGDLETEVFKASVRVRSLWDTIPKTGCRVM